jgi:hypothetical protein
MFVICINSDLAVKGLLPFFFFIFFILGVYASVNLKIVYSLLKHCVMNCMLLFNKFSISQTHH